MARDAKRHLGTENVPSGTFTEGWFRNSGLYDLRDGLIAFVTIVTKAVPVATARPLDRPDRSPGKFVSTARYRKHESPDGGRAAVARITESRSYSAARTGYLGVCGTPNALGHGVVFGRENRR
jgi:hypothetical protein